MMDPPATDRRISGRDPGNLIVCLHPFHCDGGGERFVLNAAVSAAATGRTDLVFVQSHQPHWMGLRSRLTTQFVRMKLRSGGWDSSLLTLEEVLGTLADYDHIAIYQHLGSPMVFDFLINCAPDQTVIMTSLGYEPFARDFWSIYQPASHHHFREISDYACSRVLHETVSKQAVSAAVWGRDVPGTAEIEDRPLQQACVVARVMPHKGIETAIQGVEGMGKLVVIGDTFLDPVYTAHLEALATGKGVSFAGHLPDVEKRTVLRSSDCLIAASTHTLYDGTVIEQPELLGLVIFEGLLQGCLPVTSDVPSFREIMTALRLDELVFAEGDVAAVRECVLRVRQMPLAEKEARLAKAMEIIREKYLWDDYWTRLLASTVSPS